MFSYPEFPSLDLAQITKKVASFWREHSVFEQSVIQRKKRPKFVFYEGPPSANGAPGIHHVLSRTVKDIFCRYKTQQGFQVVRKAGWDAHGLPVELTVEKQLGITKDDIGSQISVESYNAQCRKVVHESQTHWNALTEKMGYWIDTNDPYLTSNRDYIQSVWGLLKQLHEKKLLYKGHAIQPYSPAAGTGLSSHELNQPGSYRKVKDLSVVVQFKVKTYEATYFLAWTTTPWTLPANSALAVGKHITYVKVRTFNPYTYQPIYVILAKKALGRYFSMPEAEEESLFANYRAGNVAIPWQVITYYKGEDLIDQTYTQLLPYVKPNQSAFRIIHGDFVTTTEGTGIVHIAPTFGADDLRIARQAGIPAITVSRGKHLNMPIVDLKGRFVEEITDFAGEYVKEAYVADAVRQQPHYQSSEVRLIEKLKLENKAFRVFPYTHNYPHCWRTDKPIIYYPLDAWFIKTTAYKEQLITHNQAIRWQPEHIGTGRFGHWLNNLVDWNLSRDRYWGTPLPIWRTKDQTEERCIGSWAELKLAVDSAVKVGFMKAPLPEDIDLHRPHVDQIVLVSAHGQPMYRESDVIDVWFDAGAMPYAQWNYPQCNKAIFAQYFPADFIAEGVDQTRGWFFTLHVLSVLLFDRVAFKQVVANGLVLDAQGNKMSKRLGNTIDPFTVLEKYGSDAVRWYMISNTNPWENLKFDLQGLTEVTRRYFITLHHTYNFFALYANIDQFDRHTLQIAIDERPVIDRWLFSRLHTLMRIVHTAYETYEPAQVARAIQDFVVDDLSNWYVRLNRKRFWQHENSIDKLSAYQTLYACLCIVAQLSAPIAPFYMEYLYQALHGCQALTLTHSIHLTDFPNANTNIIDEKLEQTMCWGQRVVSLVHALRKQHRLKVRQPLARLLIVIPDSNNLQSLESLKTLICTEVNVKKVGYVHDTTETVIKKIKPNYRVLGKRYGARTPLLVQAIASLTSRDIQCLEREGILKLTLTLSESSTPWEVVLSLSDIMLVSEDVTGWATASDHDITVALDTTLDDNLQQEGLVRELISRIQHLRKAQKLQVTDKVSLTLVVEHNFALCAIKQYENYICQESQAVRLTYTTDASEKEKLDLNGYIVYVALRST